MKKKKSTVLGITIAAALFILLCVLLAFTGCGEAGTSYGSYEDMQNTQMAAGTLQYNQPTPTDIDYSLERYNLIRRAYWVNGQREKANALVCQIEKPLGYIVLFTESGGIVGKFTVDGKVSSLNSYLTPDSEYYEYSAGEYSKTNAWVADVDGSYGENDNGIFFFDVMGNYFEWTGTYLYTDVPMEISDPVITFNAN
jgi:hypothetical protein